MNNEDKIVYCMWSLFIVATIITIVILANLDINAKNMRICYEQLKTKEYRMVNNTLYCKSDKSEWRKPGDRHKRPRNTATKERS